MSNWNGTPAPDNARAKAAMKSAAGEIAKIDAELQEIVDLLVAGKITPLLAQVREINLRKRRAQSEKIFNAMSASIKHF